MENTIYPITVLEKNIEIKDTSMFSKSLFITSYFKNLISMLMQIFRAIGAVFFTPPPQQERIEEVRMKAMYYRGLF